VIDWTDSESLQTSDRFPGSVGDRVVHVQHQLQLSSFPKGKKIYNSQFSTPKVLPSFHRKLAGCYLKLCATAAHLHIDNVTSPRSKIFIQKIEECAFILMPQPAYSPDITPCDFFLFGNLKEQFDGIQFSSEAW
jgi:hypothetical protein